jgi:acetyl esterase/lipase
MRGSRLIVLLLLSLPTLPAWGQDSVRIEVSPKRAAYDTRIGAVIRGLPPNQVVTARLSFSWVGCRWSSRADFIADDAGHVDLSTMVPIDGDYDVADAMGLFWSAKMDTSCLSEDQFVPYLYQDSVPQITPMDFVVEVDGQAVASDTLWRIMSREGVESRRVNENGLSGVLFTPPEPGPHPALIVLSGSAGGAHTTLARAYADHGYVAFALAYFAADGVPSSLVRIPLEYFGRAIEWLADQSEVDPDRIGVIGRSKGGELALLLASTFSELAVVVAYAPSHVLWGGCCDPETFNQPAWTWNGEPLPFMPQAKNSPLIWLYAPQYYDMIGSWCSLEDIDQVERASIPVEHINGAVLLITGKDDRTWPTAYMSDQVIERLRLHDFPHPYSHLSYENAGHAILVPYWPAVTRVYHRLGEVWIELGGTSYGIAVAQEDAWIKLFKFLDDNL